MRGIPVRRAVSVALLAAALLWGFASAATVRAEEATSEDAAKAAVEAERDDVHRANVRIDWPKWEDADPPDGAEITLIERYIAYSVTRMVRNGDRVEGQTVFMGRTWLYGADEPFEAQAFDVAPDAFVRAWNAVRRVGGATAVRTTEPSGKGGGRSSKASSHSPQRWVRFRDAPGSAALAVAAAESSSTFDADGIRNWDEIRENAVDRVAAGLVPKYGRRAATFAEWEPWFTAEIVRTTRTLSVESGHTDSLLMEVCLRGAGEVGREDALGAVDALEPELRSERAFANLDECWVARTKLKLRHAFDPKFAEEFLRTTERRGGWRLDIIRWVRRRWREVDVATFAGFVRRELARADLAAEVRVERLEDLHTLPGDEPARLARPFLAAGNVRVRAAAAALLLARDRSDELALAAIDEAIGGAKSPQVGPCCGGWVRLWESQDDLRAALRGGKEDGRWVNVAIGTLDWLARGDAVQAWRAVLAQVEHLGTPHAVRSLLAERDRASFDRIEALLAHWASDAPARKAVGFDIEEVVRSQIRLDDLRKREPTPGPK